MGTRPRRSVCVFAFPEPFHSWSHSCNNYLCWSFCLIINCWQSLWCIQSVIVCWRLNLTPRLLSSSLSCNQGNYTKLVLNILNALCLLRNVYLTKYLRITRINACIFLSGDSDVYSSGSSDNVLSYFLYCFHQMQCGHFQIWEKTFQDLCWMTFKWLADSKKERERGRDDL